MAIAAGQLSEIPNVGLYVSQPQRSATIAVSAPVASTTGRESLPWTGSLSVRAGRAGRARCGRPVVLMSLTTPGSGGEAGEISLARESTAATAG